MQLIIKVKLNQYIFWGKYECRRIYCRERGRGGGTLAVKEEKKKRIGGEECGGKKKYRKV